MAERNMLAMSVATS